MNAFGEGQIPVVLQKVADLIQQRATNRADLISDFAMRLFRNISPDDLSLRNDSDMYGAVMGLWHSFNDYIPGEKALIKIYNPEVARHGWESAHTIIEIIQSDSPFMVDSIRMALSRLGITSHLLLHLPISHKRDADNNIVELLKAGTRNDDNEVDTVFLIEVDRQTSKEAITTLKKELASVMDEINLSVSDWLPMRERLSDVAESLNDIKYPGDKQQLKEAQRFLAWLAQDNFTLMGYRRYDLKPVEGDYVIRQNVESSLGLMRKSATNKDRLVSSLPEVARDMTFDENILLLTKTNTKSRVHRPAYCDYIGVKRFDKNGKVIGEDRFIGLYSSSFYNNSARDVPMVGDKIRRVMEASGFAPNSHAAKALLNILETYPRDEIVQAPEDDLLEV